MRLHKIKAGETAGTYLIESPVTEADHPADGQTAGQLTPAPGTTTDRATGCIQPPAGLAGGL